MSFLHHNQHILIMDKDDKLRLAEIHATVKTISVDLQFLRRHRNVLFGTPVLEFNEVCSVLHLSARQVQRLRERKELVGFNVGRRRLYFQTEIYDYLSRLERVTRKQPEQSMEQ